MTVRSAQCGVRSRTARSFANVALTLLLATAAGAQSVPVWKVTEELRIGSDAGPTLFADIRGIGANKAGNIVVLDAKPQEIRMFDSHGKFLKLVAGKGKGPGEITDANGFYMTPDGRIWVNDPSSARFSIYKADGSFERQILVQEWGYSYIWSGIVDPQGRIVEYFPVRGADGKSVSRYRRISDSKVDTIAMPTCHPKVTPPPAFSGRAANRGKYMAVPFAPRLIVFLDSRGTQWCTQGADYLIYNSDLEKGDTSVVIRSASARLPVTAAERAFQIHLIDSSFAAYPEKDVDYSRIPALKPAIQNMFADRNGRLWVQRTPADSTAPSVFDVWDSKGKQLATAKFGFKVPAYRPVFVNDDYVYAVTVDEDDVPYVVRAKITH